MAVVRKHRGLVQATGEWEDDLVTDLASEVWRQWDRSGHDPAKSKFVTWAGMVCLGRLRDAAARGQTNKRKIVHYTDSPPEKISKESVATPADRLTTLAGIARNLFAAEQITTSKYSNSTFTPSQIGAMLVLFLDRKVNIRSGLLMLKGMADECDAMYLDEKLPTLWTLWRASRTDWGSKRNVERIWKKALKMMGESEIDRPVTQSES